MSYVFFFKRLTVCFGVGVATKQLREDMCCHDGTDQTGITILSKLLTICFSNRDRDRDRNKLMGDAVEL